jgi:CheY-like chemotaxis protein
MNPAPRLDGMRILMVEDDGDVRETLASLLRTEGAEVASTGSGREALKLAAQGTFDVLLTDLDLPDVPGDAIIRQALAAPLPARIIVMTGSGDTDLLRARQAGAKVILLKPIDWRALIGHIRSACPQAREYPVAVGL